ncbi:hypothetical protein Aglo03_04930 [Actinokineospora globicatena]|uniref:Anti-sigma factor antagonist n=1 Tax=Actinokineospora globicatena TaxID=103729 RepID=A0A9W6QJE0_9PSEU|nr:hypothetical protein Aglo03_04930 [Actinokineospora globicatena]
MIVESNLIPFAPGDQPGTRRPRAPRRGGPKPGSPEASFRGSPLLRLAITWSGPELRVQVTGDLDVVTAPALAEALSRARIDVRAVPGAIGIVLDLRTVSFLGAAGMRVMVHAHHTFTAAGFGLRLIADQPAVTRPLALTGLDEVLGLSRVPSPETAGAPSSHVVASRRGEPGGATT